MLVNTPTRILTSGKIIDFITQSYMDFITGTDWSTWIPELGDYGVSIIIIVVSGYACLWLTAHSFARWGYDNINLPLGVKLNRDKTADNLLHQASSDAVIVQGIHEANNDLEFRTRKKMRAIMTNLTNKYMLDNTHNTLYQEYISRAKLTLSNAIADNHVVFQLSNDQDDEYIEAKQTQVVESIGADLSTDPHAVTMLVGLTKDFVVQILPVQRQLCVDKIASYEKVLNLLQLDGNKALCLSKIEKNKNYLTVVNSLQEKYGHAPILNQTTDIGGASLVSQKIENTKKMLDNPESMDYTKDKK